MKEIILTSCESTMISYNAIDISEFLKDRNSPNIMGRLPSETIMLSDAIEKYPDIQKIIFRNVSQDVV